MSDTSQPIAVTCTGLVRGHELSGGATLTLRGELVELVTRATRHTLPLGAIAGARVLESGALELSMEDGDVVVLFAGINGAAALSAIAEELLTRACAMPELTRSLRGLGSHRARPGAEHDRFFRPLLEARRGAERAARYDGARLAFDAASIRAAFTRRLREMAHDRHPNDPPERRALEAEATDAAAPLFAAIAELETAQRAFDAAGDHDRIARWRTWTGALQRVFERADDVWIALESAFGGAPAKPSGLRRLFRGKRNGADA
jgi:hypothetical protein